jgi:hypothetical protein
MLNKQAKVLAITTVMDANPGLITEITEITVVRVGVGAGASLNRDATLRTKAISFQRKRSREISGKHSVPNGQMDQATRQIIRSPIL